MPVPSAGTSAEERPDASEGVEGAVVVDDAAIDPGPERARGRALEGVSIRSAVQAIDAANAGGGRRRARTAKPRGFSAAPRGPRRRFKSGQVDVDWENFGGLTGTTL